MSKIREYFELRTSKGVAYVKFSSIGLLVGSEGLVLDCDGVLIDSRTSYDEAIRESVTVLANIITGMVIEPSHIPLQTIYTIRGTGGFNNDWDTVHLLTSWLSLHAPDESLEKLKELITSLDDRDKLTPDEFSRRLAEERGHELRISPEKIREITLELERALQKYTNSGATYKEIEGSMFKELIGEKTEKYIKYIIDALSYPNKYGKSLLVTVFDESFFGSENIKTIHGTGPFFNLQGKLKDEKLLVDENTLRWVKKFFKKIGLATGRGSWETKKTLDNLFSYFHEEACVFIADKIASMPEAREVYEKPNPRALIESVERLNVSTSVIYVGDSPADLLMWRRAKERIGDLLFAGVYGGVNELDRLDSFIEGGADLIIPSLDALPKVLEILAESQ